MPDTLTSALYRSAGVVGVVQVGILFVVLTPARLVRGAEESTSDGARLRALIRNVLENESVYDNIDVRLRQEYVLRAEVGSGSVGPRMRAAKTSTKSIHYVGQDGMFRCDLEANDLYGPDDTFLWHRARLYDGEKTRLFEKHNKIANVIDGRSGDDAFVLPHMLLLRDAKLRMPLSTYLGGDEAVARDQDARSSVAGMSVSAAYEGEDVVDGLLCDRVAITDSLRRTGQPHDRWHLWLARDRNYLPVRVLAFTFHHSETLPIGEGAVRQFVEISPGVWFPFEAEVNAYEPRALREGRQQLAWEEKYAVETVGLNPEHDVGFFRDLEFPDGTAVYFLRDGKLLASYRVGAPTNGSPAPAPPLRLWWVVVGNIGVASLVVVILVWRRHLRNCRRGPISAGDAGGG